MTRLSPSNLANRLRVLSSSPQWRVVQSAVEQLAKDREDEALMQLFDEPDRAFSSTERKRIDELEARLETAKAYVEMFEDYSASLSEILLVAAALGEFVPEKRDSDKPLTESDRLYEGVDVLRRHLQFGSVTTPTERGETVGRVRQKGSILPELILHNEGVGQVDLEAFETWENELWVLVADIRERARYRKDESLNTAVLAAWAEWHRRFGKYLSKNELRFQPLDFDLICDAAKRSPGDVLNPDLRRCNLAQWSAVLARALGLRSDDAHGPIPLWAAIPAAVRLNLSWLILRLENLLASNRASELFGNRKRPTEEDIRGFMVMVDEHRDRLHREANKDVTLDQVMVVAGEEPGITRYWRVANELGALAIDEKTMESMAPMMESVIQVSETAETPLPEAGKFLRLYDAHPPRREALLMVKQGMQAWNNRAPPGNDAFLLPDFDKELDPLLQLEHPRNISEAVQMFHQLRSSEVS